VVSWDREHRRRGITEQHIINFVSALGPLFGVNAGLGIQTVKLIGDDSKRDLLQALTAEGWLAADADLQSDIYVLTNGITLQFNEIDVVCPVGRARSLEKDTDYFWVPVAKETLLMRERSDCVGRHMRVISPTDAGARYTQTEEQLIVLGPDGQFYLDDKFMLRRSTPLGSMADIEQAVRFVNQHPILRALLTKALLIVLIPTTA